ncbi:MAG: hypothetical protein U0804_13300 [Gemmataceae bacterium]
MLILYRGMGVYLLWIWVASFFGGIAIANEVFGEDVHFSVIGLTINLLAAILALGLALIVRRRSAKSAKLGTASREKHDLYFIPIGWWAILFAVFGVAFYFGSAPSAGRP